MIVEWFLDLWANFVEWIMSFFGELELPDWFLTGTSSVLSVINNGAGLGAWVPWGIVVGAVTVTFVIWFAGFGLKFARWLIGLIPTMGGG